MTDQVKKQQKTILVVDDSDLDRTLFTKVLSKKYGHKIIEAENGEKCVEALKSNSIDLVLLDIMLPDVLGTELLKKIREEKNQIQLPIIMVTAKTEVSDIIEALQSGANDYITKPIHFEIAISRISAHLRLSEASTEMTRLHGLTALHALITTYNHEINNPLTIALGYLKKLETETKDSETLKKAEDALWRVVDIVKKIKKITEEHSLEFESYAGSGKMIRLK